MGIWDIFKRDDDKQYRDDEKNVKIPSRVKKNYEKIDEGELLLRLDLSKGDHEELVNKEEQAVSGESKQNIEKKEKSDEQSLGVLGRGYTRYVPRIKKNIIILAIENTSKVREYKEIVLKIISKIIEDNKDSMFAIFRMGCHPKYFGILPYDIIQKNQIKERVLKETDEQDKSGFLYEVLKYVKHIINKNKISFNRIEVEDIEYEITGYNIVFLGTANFESSTNELSAEILKELKSNKKINSIKYFCIDDKNTINAASIGFPLIGHIESNFYK